MNNEKNTSYKTLIDNAEIYDLVNQTPLSKLEGLSQLTSQHILIKREDLQDVHSFKIRGAYNRIKQLSENEQSKGVIAASAGNHAQGVAVASKKMGIHATIVMPNTTPSIKIDSVKKHGATIILHGDNYDTASDYAKTLAKEQEKVYIHPYDDPYVIAGQGTIGKELVEQLDTAPDAIFIAVGGGGLIAGIGAYIKEKWPQTKIIGVEPEDAASMSVSLEAGKRIELPEVGIFADGVAVKLVGKETFECCQNVVDAMLTVSTDEICAAIKDIYDNCRAIAEPAGALGLAGLKKYCDATTDKNQTLVTLNCGANINFDRLRHVSERAEIGEGKEAIYAVEIPEEAGSFKRFINTIGNRAITEFNYRYNSDNRAEIFVGIELKNGHSERHEIYKLLKDNGYSTIDLTENEMAKVHIRHMVGGRNKTIKNECIYRFQFPERPGALKEFLTQMPGNWNITLFHYRNHGTDYGRVLAGFDIKEEELETLECFLQTLNFRYIDETHNPAYRLFL